MAHTSSGVSQRLRWSALVLASLGFEALSIFKPGTQTQLSVANESLLGLAGLIAFIACRRRSGREVGRHRKGWMLLGLGCLSFGLGQFAFALQSLRSHEPDPLSPATVLVVLAIPLVAGGLLSFSGSSLTSRVITTLDAATITLSLLFIGWVLVLGPVYRDSENLGEQLATLAYVGGSLSLTALVLLLAMRWRGDGVTLLLLGIAFAWTSAANAAYGLKVVEERYATGDALIDLGWFTPFLLIAVAATRRSPHSSHDHVNRRWFLTLFLPYTTLLLVATTSVAVMVGDAPFDLALQVSGVLTVALVLSRQLVTLVKHHALTVDLERRVEERAAAARHIDARLQSMLRNSTDVIAVQEATGLLSYVSPASWSLLGLQPEALIGRSILDFVHPDDRANTGDRLYLALHEPQTPDTVACRVAGRHGEWRHVEATVSLLRDAPIATALILNLRDVSDRARLQDELQHQASYDMLTSLANRRLFNERVRHALDRAMRTGEPLSVLFIDLDHFKRINDTAGHSVGDALLAQVADRLLESLRPADTAARLGGDEFAVLLEDTDLDHAEEVAGRVVAALTPPYAVADTTLALTASVGIATTGSGSHNTGEALLRDADVAMYHAKAQGRARFASFQPQMHTRLLAQMELEIDLREAVAQQQLRLVYQPLIDLRTGTVTGVEALVRWEGRGHIDVPPAMFIPLAEERGLITMVDQWVMREACRQLKQWQREIPGAAALRANVNVSAVDLREPVLAQRIAGLLDETELAPRSLTVEITETAVLPELDALLPTLHALRDLGVGISLDDFGTGYSSLSSLRRFPLDEIKIDQSFVANIDQSASGRRLVTAIVNMAQALDLGTVAEAVETPDQLAHLRRMRCDSAQGYLFSPPLEAQEMTDLLLAGSPGQARPLVTARTVATPDGAVVVP